MSLYFQSFCDPPAEPLADTSSGSLQSCPSVSAILPCRDKLEKERNIKKWSYIEFIFFYLFTLQVLGFWGLTYQPSVQLPPWPRNSDKLCSHGVCRHWKGHDGEVFTTADYSDMERHRTTLLGKVELPKLPGSPSWQTCRHSSTTQLW